MRQSWHARFLLGALLLLLQTGLFSPPLYLGNASTGKFHRGPGHARGLCASAARMAPRNIVVLDSLAHAAAQGFTPCKVCKPER